MSSGQPPAFMLGGGTVEEDTQRPPYTKPGRKKRELEQDAAFSLVPIHVFFSYQGGIYTGSDSLLFGDRRLNLNVFRNN